MAALLDLQDLEIAFGAAAAVRGVSLHAVVDRWRIGWR